MDGKYKKYMGHKVFPLKEPTAQETDINGVKRKLKSTG